MRKINWPSLQNSNLVETTAYIPLAQMLQKRKGKGGGGGSTSSLRKIQKRIKSGRGKFPRVVALFSSARPRLIPYASIYQKRGRTRNRTPPPRFSNATLPDYRKLETPDKRVPFLLVQTPISPLPLTVLKKFEISKMPKLFYSCSPFSLKMLPIPTSY